MTLIKWIFLIIWRCLIIPVLVTVVVMVATMFFINDTNQTKEREKEYSQNYGTSYHNNRELANENPNFTTKYNQYNSTSDKRYHRERVEMNDSDFDTTSIVSMIALFGSFLVMLIYTISDIRDRMKASE